MSKTVDERVVEMRFDNAQFERNVQTSMSTLAKLKQSLNLSKSSKGLEDIGKAANNINFSNIEKSLYSLEKRFSLFGTVKEQVIKNFTNSAMASLNKVMSTINSFTIGGIKTGGYNRAANLEKAQFQLQGLLKDGQAVNAVMENVKTSVDGTAYSLDAAAVVASQLAASGMRAGDQMLTSLKAVAGVAAMTGSNYEDIGRIFTQVAGQGRLMGNDLLQLSGRGMNAAATIADYLTKVGNGAKVTEADVRDMVSKGKISFEIFANAMDSAFGEHATKANETFTGAMSNMKSALARIGEIFYTPILADNGPLVKFFNALRIRINEIKDAIKPVVELLADITVAAINAGTSIVEKINLQGFFDIFRKASSTVSDAVGKIGKAVDVIKAPINKAAESVDTVTSAVTDLGKVVDDVIIGKFGNGQDRFNALAAAGINYYEVQNKVNETLGCSKRYTQEQIDAQNQLLGIQGQLVSTTDTAVQNTSDLNTETGKLSQTQKDLIKQQIKMDDSQLKSLGYTEEQIKAFHDLRDIASKLGMPLDDFIDKMDEIDGKWIIFDSFRNAGKALQKVFTSIGAAFKEVFEPMKSDTIFNIIAGLHKFTASMIMSDETADKLQRTFQGLFSALDLVRMVVGGTLGVAFKILRGVLNSFHIDVLDITAAVGDAITKFRQWVKAHSGLSKAFSGIVDILHTLISGIIDCVTQFMQLEEVQQIIKDLESGLDKLKKTVSNLIGSIDIRSVISNLKSGLGNISSWIKGLKNSDHLGEDIIRGIVNGIKNGVNDAVEAIKDIATAIMDTFCELLGIHSPSKWGEERGENIVEGVANGIDGALGIVTKAVENLVQKIIETFDALSLDGSKKVSEFFDSLNFNIPDIGKKLDPIITSIKKLTSNFTEFVKSIDFKSILAIIPVGITVLFSKRLYDLASTLENGINSINAVIKGFAGVEKSFAGVLDSFAKDIKSKALMRVAISIGILAASVVALSLIDTKGLIKAVGAIVILAGTLAVLSLAVNKIDAAAVKLNKSGLNVEGLKTTLLQIGVVMALLALSVKMMGTMNPDQLKQGFTGLAACVTAIAAVLVAFGVVSGLGKTADINGVGSMILKVSIAMLLMVGVCKLAGQLKPEEMKKGAIFAAGFSVFVMAMSAAYRLAGDGVNKLGGMMIKLSIALGLMVGVCKLIGLLSPAEMAKGALFITGFVVFVTAISVISKLLPISKATKLGGTMIALTVVLGLMVGVCKLIGLLSPAEMAKGAAFTAGFILLIGLLVKVSTISNTEQMAKVGATILAMSIAIGAMTAVCILMSLLTDDMLYRGIAAVTAFGTMMAIMTASAKGVTDIKGTIGMMAVCIGVMAVAVAALSFVDPQKLITATACLSALMAMFTLIESQAKHIGKAIGGLLAMSVAIGVIGGMLFLVGQLPVRNAVAASVSLGGVLAALTASISILSNTSGLSNRTMVSVGVMVLALVGIGTVIGILSGINGIDNAIAVSAGLSIMLVSLAAAIRILGDISNGSVDTAGLIKFALAIGVLTAAFALLVPSLQSMQSVRWETLLKAGAALAGLAVGVKAMDGSVEGAIAAGVMAVSLNLLVPVLERLGAMSLKEIGKSILALAGALAVLEAASGVVGVCPEIAIGLELLTYALLMFGIAVLAFGGGVALLAQGLQTMSSVGTDAAQKVVKSIETIVIGILKLIPKITAAMTKAVVAVCNVLTNSAPAIGKAVVAVLTSILTSMVEAKAQLIDSLATLLVGVLDGLTEKLPELLDSLANFVVALINGLAEHMPEFIEAGVNLLSSILQGIVDNLDSIINGIVVPLVGVFKEVLVGVLEVIAPYIPIICASIVQMTSIICEALVKITELLAPYIPNIQAIVESVTTGVVAICNAFTNLINQIAPIINSISDLIRQLGDSISQVLNSVSELVAQIGDSISQVLESLGDTFTDFGEGVRTAFDGVADVIESVGDSIEKVFDGMSEVITSVGESIRDILDGLADVFESIGDAALNAGKGFEKLANGVKTITNLNTKDMVYSLGEVALKVKKIGDNSEGLANAGKGMKQLVDSSRSIDSAFTSMSTGITQVVTSLASIGPVATMSMAVLVSAINSSLSSFTTLSTTATTSMTMMMTTMALTIITQGSLIVAAFDTMMSSVMMSITSRQEAMVLAGTTMMLGLSMGIIAGTAVVAETITNVMLQISTLVIGNMAIFAVAGVSLMSGLCIGIMTGVGLVNTALYSALSNAASILLSNLGTFMSAGIILMAGLQAGMLAGGVGIPAIISTVITMGLSMILSRAGMFMSAGLQLMTGLRTGITGGMGTVLSAINTVTTRAYTMIMSKRGQFTNAGRSLIAGLATGLRTGVGLVNAAISSTMSGCAAAIRSHYGSFKSAGQYLGDGLCIGISLKTSAAYQAGFALGKAAVDGEKAGQQSRSPSKATKKAGKWLGEGLIIGMGQMSKSVYESGKAMGQNAVESISGALSKINTLSADGSDFAPTIRPVVDMDAFQNGSETLSIGANLSANLLSKPVATLQDLMTDTQANIDASNNEVIKAITDLRDDLNGYYSGEDSEIALYMDTKKVASTLAKPMNRQLNILSKRGAY